MSVWRYAGHLMGIPDTILYKNTAEAEKIYKIRPHVRAAGRHRFDNRGERAAPGHSVSCGYNRSG